ncbi:MAG: D-alanyl-D-alanine carboxypeptidase family protein [Spirochaetales bacterium]
MSQHTYSTYKKMPVVLGVLIWLVAWGFFHAYLVSIQNFQPQSLIAQENESLEQSFQDAYVNKDIVPLSWEVASFGIDSEIPVNAQAAILIDIDSGAVLFEKNADEIIPPASMTKLVAMYVVFQEIATGAVSLDDIVPLPPESWATNAPPGSSLMFLNDGHIVTLYELLLGLALPSGNDAAVAVAYYISGGMEEFLQQMNSEVANLGLANTHFVDSSGYDEKNTTTAREFATFARHYVQQYPESLDLFHSVKSMVYPQEHNLPTWRKGKDLPITKANTNPALGVIEGVTGLKTGFIPQSGYNFVLTIERDGTRILSVTMGGPGKNTSEGNRYRLQDARNISNYAYDNFKTVHYDDLLCLNLPVLGGNENIVYVHEYRNEGITVPANAETLTRTVDIPPFCTSPIMQGDVLGKVVYTVDDITVLEIDLYADRTIENAGTIKSSVDYVVAAILSVQ